jgi:ELWxxDGT repeat protein/probable HAF family extracellular repeat protein
MGSHARRQLLSTKGKTMWARALVNRLRTHSSPAGIRPKRPVPGPLTVEALEDRCLLSATLVKDVNPGAADSSPAGLVNVQGQLFFAASDGSHGVELWKSDGTAAGTNLVKDVNPGSAGSAPADLTAVNGTLYFTADDGSHGRQLWKSDGTVAGTLLVKDSAKNSFPSPANLTAVNGMLFFTNSAGYLCRTDGTTAGTLQVSTKPGTGNLIGVNGALFFTTYTTSISYYTYVGSPHPNREFITETVYLWKSDGTTAGTLNLAKIYNVTGSVPLGSTYRPPPPHLEEAAVGGNLFFGQGGQLWQSDGTSGGTREVTVFTAGPVDQLTDLNGTLLFTADDGTTGRELWKSDGTPAGTVLVKDVNLGSAGSSPARLTTVNGTLYFSADDGVHGPELWKSNGNTTGTSLVADLVAGSAGSDPGNLTAAGSTLFFTATDPTYGNELWQSDGTPAGTRLYQDVNPGNASSNPQDLTVVGSHLYFAADDGTHGIELWDPPVAQTSEQDPVSGYTVTDLGTLGGTDATPLGINDRSQVVGVSTTVGGDTHAFLWQLGRMTDLGTLGGTFSEAYVINARGEIAGGATVAGGDEHPVIWDHGRMIDLTPGAGPGSGGLATAINDSGEVVGQLYFPDGSGHAFVYDDGGLHDLHEQVSLGGNVDAFWDVNDRGQIVGRSAIAAGDPHAILYDSSGVHDLGTAGGTWSEASSINEAGQISGNVGYDPNERCPALPMDLCTDHFIHSHGFLYTEGVMHDLGAVPGASWSQGTWIDAQGRVFGGSIQFAGTPGAPPDGKATTTLWDDGHVIDLEPRLINPPTTLYPNNLGVVEWGNARGQLVAWGVLAGSHPGEGDFHSHGFLLTPVADLGERDTDGGLHTEASNNRGSTVGVVGQSGQLPEGLGNVRWSAAEIVFALLADEARRKR